jgi:hypothetical protein
MPVSAPAAVKEEPKVEEKRPVVADEEESKPEVEEFDLTKVDPTDWECFGQIEPNHGECKTCPHRVVCAEKSGVKI